MQEDQEGIDESQYRTIEQILQASKDSATKLKEEIEYMEQNERKETVESVRNAIKADNLDTVRKKDKFINELKSGMIEDIKRNEGVRRVQPEEESGEGTVKKFLKNIFTKF